MLKMLSSTIVLARVDHAPEQALLRSFLEVYPVRDRVVALECVVVDDDDVVDGVAFLQPLLVQDGV